MFGNLLNMTVQVESCVLRKNAPLQVALLEH